MLIRLLVLVGAIAALLVSPAAAQPGAILEPNDRVAVGLNVRADPTSAAAIVTVLRPGDRVEQVGAVPYWYHVRLPDGTEGWAAKGYLRVAAAPAPNGNGIDLARLRIHVIDVGVGDAILIDYGDKEIFIDGGMGVNLAWKHVKDLIQDPIELVIVTHADTDHWKGLTRILGLEPNPRTPHFRAVEFWDPGYDRGCDPGSATASYLNFISGVRSRVQRFLRPLEATHTPLVLQATPSLTAFVELPELPGFKLLVLHTNASPNGRDCAYTINNASIVFKLVVGATSFLFTGDANGKDRDGPDSPTDVEAQLLALEDRLPGVLRADVLKAPHHGSETASTTAFLQKVRPRFAIVSASTNHHLPRPTTLARYTTSGAVILRTDQDRKSDNDHIVCYFTTQLAVDCNYADLLE